MGLLSSVLTIVIPVSIGIYYDLAFNFNAHRAQVLSFLPDAWLESIPNFLILFGVLVLARFIFFIGHRITFRNINEGVIRTIKDELFSHQLKTEYKTYHKKGTSKYLLRYSGDITSLKNLLNQGFVTFIVDVILGIIGFVWLCRLHLTGGLVILAGSLFGFLIIVFLTKKIESFSLVKRNDTSGLLSFVNRTFRALPALKIYTKEKIELNKFSKRNAKVWQNSLNYVKYDSLLRGFIHFLQYFLLIPVLYLIGNEIQSQNHLFTAGSAISFLLLYITIMPVLRRVQRVPSIYKLGFISLDKLLNIKSIPIESEKGEVLTTKNPRFELVDFTYNREEKINFRSEKGAVSTLALGNVISKKEFIHVLTRLSDFTYGGAILINNESLQNFTIASIRKNIGFVSSQIPLMDRKAFGAISYSRGAKNKLKAEGILESVFQQFGLEQNLFVDSPIGENGADLSAMHIEVLVLSRALCNQRNIVFVDDLPILESINKKVLQDLLKETGQSLIMIA